MSIAQFDEESIFHAVRQVFEDGARERFIEQACGTDGELKGRVLELLRVHREEGNFLEPRPAPAPTVDMPGALTERPGSQIGPYKLREQIGEGGFGVVYVAEQMKPVRRKVALKVVKPGMDTKDVIARFEAERQALALMDHPNVAKVLDAGATDSGRPYFVMELVRGVPVTEFCDEQKLSTRERLRLFVDVCRAVQHAHQKGIIHRDLKPSNVMVTLHDGVPVPKVIDFGVSKALSQQLTEKTLYTAYGQMLGTPLYMSPEQSEMSGLDVDTRSDVYSLGVLLYELLTGTTPFDKETLKNAGFDEFRRMIKESEPPRPSMRISTLNAEALCTISHKRNVDPRKLGQSYRGELDWIVMKALEKDRNRRYESANAFAADIERFLANEPVQACPPSMWYRFRKFARRRKGVMAVAASSGIGLVVAVGAIAGSAGWIARDRDARKTRIAGEVQLILNEVDRLVESQKWTEALATTKQAYAAIGGGDADSETRQKVLVALDELSLVEHLERAREIKSVAKDVKFNQEGAAREYAATFRDVGIDVLGLPRADVVQKLRSYKRTFVPLCAALDDWAGCLRATDRHSDAERLQEIANAIDPNPWSRKLRVVARNDGPDGKSLKALATTFPLEDLRPASIVIFANELAHRGGKELAIAMLRNSQQLHPGDFWINFNLGVFCFESGPQFLAESVGCYRAALAIRPLSAAALNNLGMALRAQGRTNDAIACFRRAIEFDPEFSFPRINLEETLRGASTQSGRQIGPTRRPRVPGKTHSSAVSIKRAPRKRTTIISRRGFRPRASAPKSPPNKRK